MLPQCQYIYKIFIYIFRSSIAMVSLDNLQWISDIKLFIWLSFGVCVNFGRERLSENWKMSIKNKYRAVAMMENKVWYLQEHVIRFHNPGEVNEKGNNLLGYLHRAATKSFGESYMKKSKLNVQRYICILLCLVLYITVLPFTVSADPSPTWW